MSQTIITARIVGQAVLLANETLLASGSQGALQIRCEFDSTWNGYGKTAVFYRDKGAVYHIAIADGIATIPHEVLAEEGDFYFGVFGVAENTRTTEVVRLAVTQGAITTATAETAAPTPNIYSQLLAAYGQLETALQVERSRINQLVGMRGAGGVGTFNLSDEYVFGTIKSNGYSAYIDFKITSLSLVAGGYHYTDYCIPPELASLCPVELKSSNPNLNITLEAAEAVQGWSRLLIENPSNSMYTTDMETTVNGTYPLATPFNSEVADIRVTAYGDNYETAGEAVREQHLAAMAAVEKTLPAINEKGDLVVCTPAEGLPLEVVSHISSAAAGTTLVLHHTGKNLWDFKSGMSQCLGKSGSTGADVIRYGYIVTLPPGTYTISAKVLSGDNYVYFNPINLSTLVMGSLTYFITGAKATTTKVTLTEGQGLYIYDAARTTISAASEAYAKQAFYENTNIQIEAGATATPYEPYQGEVKTVALPEGHPGGLFNWSSGTYEEFGGNGGIISDPQPISPSPGVNYLWSSTGETEVKGSADINGVIETLTSAIIALGGNI